MCITEDHLLSREGWSQLESVEMELTGPRMKLWFKRNKRNLSMVVVTATILRKIEDYGAGEEELAS